MYIRTDTCTVFILLYTFCTQPNLARARRTGTLFFLFSVLGTLILRLFITNANGVQIIVIGQHSHRGNTSAAEMCYAPERLFCATVALKFKYYACTCVRACQKFKCGDTCPTPAPEKDEGRRETAVVSIYNMISFRNVFDFPKNNFTAHIESASPPTAPICITL